MTTRRRVLQSVAAASLPGLGSAARAAPRPPLAATDAANTSASTSATTAATAATTSAEISAETSAATPAETAATATAAPALYELRRYTCKPGQRDVLLRLFETHFQDAYEATGTRVLASFRDLDDADRWVWLRAFTGPVERGTALRAFYGSAAWTTHRAACNATLRDIAPALLLRAAEAARMPLPATAPGAGAMLPGSRFLLEIHPLVDAAALTFMQVFERDARPLFAAWGATSAALWLTDAGTNHFPRQPVRPGTCCVTLTRFADAAALRSFEAARSSSATWRERVAPALAALRTAPLEAHRLQPAARSA
jgi:hypothetical protein